MEERSGPRRRSDSDDSDSTIFVHEDQLIEIQKRLPVKSLCRFKCVSRQWCSLISSPSFIDSHFTHSATRPKLLVSFPAKNPDGRVGVRLCLVDQSDPRNVQPQIVTPRLLLPERHGSFYSVSVEGLICLEVASGVDICNPSTGKQVTFGSPGTAARFPNMRARHSFGFDPVERKHKVLCVTRTRGRQFTVKSWVFTLGMKEWRRVEDCAPHYKFESEFCFDGVVYYMAGDCTVDSMYLVAFHLRTESLRMIMIPAEAREPVEKVLIKFEGHLAMVDCSDALSGAEVIVWILEDFDPEIWNKRVFVLPPCWQEMVGDRCVFAVGILRSGELLFAPETFSKSVWVFYYDLKTNGFRWSEICGLPDPAPGFLFRRCELRFSDHVESLLPL